MLSDKEIVDMTAQVHMTLKKHEQYRLNIINAREWTIKELKNSQDKEKTSQLNSALEKLAEAEANIDKSLMDLKEKLTELGFGLVFETAKTLMNFPI